MGFNQAQVAEIIGISQPAISLAERGSFTGMCEENIEMLKLILFISEDEIPKFERIINNTNRKKVFISYAHEDELFVKRLLIHLKPLEKKGLIDAWSDRRISPGSLWRNEIEKELKNAYAAILMISADFLSSDFIIDNELPPLLASAQNEGVTIIPVILKPCRFVREPILSKFHAVNSPEEPLSGLNEHNCELIYDAIAQKVEEFL